MKIKLNKVREHNWNIEANGETIGHAKLSPQGGGTYEAELNNGIKIRCFNQKSLKEMVSKNWEESK